MKQLSYLDFELSIGMRDGDGYPVSVVHSPAGEAHETLRLPFDDAALEKQLLVVENAILRSGNARRRIGTSEEAAVQHFGQLLFDALLTGEVRTRYVMSQRAASEQGKGLRIKLRVQPPELAVLPWEFLYDPREADYVVLSRHTPLVRYPEVPQQVQPLAVEPPLRILAVVSSPSDLAPLDVVHERQRMTEAVQPLLSAGVIELHWLPNATWRELQRAMLRGPWHVFHYIGHGDFDAAADEGVLALTDEHGRTHRLSATALGRLLNDHHPLRLALLNACEGARSSERDIFSGVAATLIRRGLPAVVAMQYEISDVAAIEFARAFYDTLATGMPIEGVVAEARKSVCFALPHSMEWATPVLFSRSPDGRLFEVPPARRRRTLTPLPPPEPVDPVPDDPAPEPVDPVPEPVEPRPALPLWQIGAGIALALLLALGGWWIWAQGGASTDDELAAASAGASVRAATPSPAASVAASQPGGGIGASTTTPTLPAPTPSPGATSPPAASDPVVPVGSAFAPGGRLVFVRDMQDGSDEELYRYDLASGTITRLTDNEVRDAIPRWSADGERIAYTSIAPENVAAQNYDIWVMRADGSEAAPRVTTPSWDEYAAWAPDGERIVFSTSADTDGVFESELHISEADGSVRRLTTNRDPDEWPSWSPDGQQIVSGSRRAGTFDIVVRAADGGDERRLTSTAAYDNQPAWSPDGRWIAFTRRAAAGNPYGDIWVVALDGSAQQLTSGGDASDPAWSPDGTWLVFTRGIDQDRDGLLTGRDPSDLWAIELATGTLRPLVEAPGHDWAPSWAP